MLQQQIIYDFTILKSRLKTLQKNICVKEYTVSLQAKYHKHTFMLFNAQLLFNFCFKKQKLFVL